MARLVFEENYRIHFATSISNTAAPSVAEIAAATEITTFVPKDGVNYGGSDQRVATGNISTAFDAETIGSYGVQLSMTFFLDDSSDTAWNLFPRGTAGFMIIAPYGYSGAGAAGAEAALATNRVFVFPVQAGQSLPGNPAANTRQTFTTSFAVTSTPNFRAAIA